MTLQADLNALETDATTWDDISTTLGNASGAASGLVLGTSELSWAAEVTGLTTAYAEFQDKVSDRLSEGSTETSTIAGGLRTVKRSYESTDAATRDDFVGLWDVK